MWFYDGSPKTSARCPPPWWGPGSPALRRAGVHPERLAGGRPTGGLVPQGHVEGVRVLPPLRTSPRPRPMVRWLPIAPHPGEHADGRKGRRRAPPRRRVLEPPSPRRTSRRSSSCAGGSPTGACARTTTGSPRCSPRTPPGRPGHARLLHRQPGHPGRHRVHARPAGVLHPDRPPGHHRPRPRAAPGDGALLPQRDRPASGRHQPAQLRPCTTTSTPAALGAGGSPIRSLPGAHGSAPEVVRWLAIGPGAGCPA